MRAWGSESQFGRSVSALCDKLGLFHVRIESGSTCRGIPDLYIEGVGFGVWVELKRERRKCVNLSEGDVTVHWREGQLMWMWRKWKGSGYKRPCYTLIAFNDCIGLLPVMKLYENNRVPVGDIMLYTTLDDALRKLMYG